MFPRDSIYVFYSNLVITNMLKKTRTRQVVIWPVIPVPAHGRWSFGPLYLYLHTADGHLALYTCTSTRQVVIWPSIPVPAHGRWSFGSLYLCLLTAGGRLARYTCALLIFWRSMYEPIRSKHLQTASGPVQHFQDMEPVHIGLLLSRGFSCSQLHADETTGFTKCPLGF